MQSSRWLERSVSELPHGHGSALPCGLCFRSVPSQVSSVALVAGAGQGLSVHKVGELAALVVQLVVGHELVQLTLLAAGVVVVGAEAGVTGNF